MRSSLHSLYFGVQIVTAAEVADMTTRVLQGECAPAHATQDVALVGSAGLGSDSALPVRLVQEDGAKVAHDIDDTKDQTTCKPSVCDEPTPQAMHR
jgi:hypothetical protein